MNVLRRQACILLAACVAAPVLAQTDTNEFPQREVRLLVPFPPGGPTDVIARILAQGLDAKWGPPVIVENRPGAGTLIATQQIAKAPPDGHLFGMVISAYTINPAIRSNMPYDTLRDLTGITQVARANMVLVAAPDTPFSTVPELIEYARANPGKLSYATPGPGTATHLAGELFKKEAGVDIVHVPYNGSGPALTDLMGGRVDIMFDIYHSVKPHVEAGKLKLLALTAAERDPAQPDVPVIAEQLPGFEVYSTIGMVAPAGTPAPVIQRIQQDLADILASAEVRERFGQLGITPVGSTPDDWNAFVRSEIERWTEVARDNNIRIE